MPPWTSRPLTGAEYPPGNRIVFGPLRFLLPVAALAIAIPAGAIAQQEARAVRANPTPPTIDGKLDDEVWQHAVPITEFRQRNPVEGAPATERTDVRFVYSDRDLYV